MARGVAAEMRAVVQGRLGVALAPAGWVAARPSRESSFVLSEFVHPLANDMAATAAVSLASSIPDRLPVRITHLQVGVCYEPLRRLWPLLGDRYRLALLQESVAPDERTARRARRARRRTGA